MNYFPPHHKTKRSRWARRLFFAGLLLASTNLSGILQAGDTPMRTVEEFKRLIDRSDLVGLCRLMAEADGSGPLKTSNYEQTQLSFENLGRMWSGHSFSYVSERYSSTAATQRATIVVRIARHDQEVRFTLLKFETGWYISDIEIFFR